MKTIIKIMTFFLGMQTSIMLCSSASSIVSPATRLLYTAIRKDDKEAVSKFIQQGADVNDINVAYKLRTPLHVAVLQRNPDIVEILLDAGADQNVRDADSKTSLDYIKNVHDVKRKEIIALFKQQKKLDYEAAFNPDGTMIEFD